MNDDLVIAVPAAGASARMGGRDKLLESVDGQPLIARQVRMALDSGAPVLVTLPPGAAARARRAALAGLDGDRLTLREVHDAAEGLGASIRAGAGWAAHRGADRLMILLADLPELESADLAALAGAAAAAPALVWRAGDAAGRPGHPVIFPSRLFPALAGVTGDAGARDLLRNEAVRLHPLPGRRATTDLDTPEAWAAWRARTGR